MKFTCPNCGKEMDADLLVIVPHNEEHIIDEIKKKNPDWVESDGICKKCYEYYKSQLHPKE